MGRKPTPAHLAGCFGPARGFSDVDGWQAIESVVAEFPWAYKEFAAAYGPGVVVGFLQVLHPQSPAQTMLDTMAQMGPLYQELVPEEIPHDLFPHTPGMVQWAQTREGDACFLVPRPAAAWGIGVWFRQWAQWEEYDHDLPD